jgi:predicted branched-subunit amino acid permease
LVSRQLAGFFRALKSAPRVPAAVLCFSYIGFGAFCHSTDLGLAAAVYTTIFVFALPAQVILVDEIGRNASLAATALAVAFTGVRLLPMTVALMPHFLAGGRAKLKHYLAAHFVAVTMWIESMRRVPGLPLPMRLPFFLGLALVLVGTSVCGTIAGYILAGVLPSFVAAALIFLTPMYFTLGLLGSCRVSSDYAPIILGFCLAPFFAAYLPSGDLLATGLVGGTLSFLIRRSREQAPKQPEVSAEPATAHAR